MKLVIAFTIYGKAMEECVRVIVYFKLPFLLRTSAGIDLIYVKFIVSKLYTSSRLVIVGIGPSIREGSLHLLLVFI